MFDREMAQVALARMGPEHRALAEAQATARGMTACDIVLEAGLETAKAESGKALYALKQRASRPQLRAVQ